METSRNWIPCAVAPVYFCFIHFLFLLCLAYFNIRTVKLASILYPVLDSFIFPYPASVFMPTRSAPAISVHIACRYTLVTRFHWFQTYCLRSFSLHLISPFFRFLLFHNLFMLFRAISSSCFLLPSSRRSMLCSIILTAAIAVNLLCTCAGLLKQSLAQLSTSFLSRS